MTVLAIILASSLSIWDYPARYPKHEALVRQFVVAVKNRDTGLMEQTSRKGVELLPDDPLWHYNLACSLAYFPWRRDEAFDELESAIDKGFRDVKAIDSDNDLKQLKELPRFGELKDYAKEMKDKPILLGPMANMPAEGVWGKQVTLGEQNLRWDFVVGCFVADMKLRGDAKGKSHGDLYMNRDNNHSPLNVGEFPGITTVRLDSEGHKRKMDENMPNMLLPHPVFGNCSQAFVYGPYWRSIPRAMMTCDPLALRRMAKFYLSNQVWVFPSNADTAPVGTNGDVFASIAPYWITTAGRSYSDMPYVRAALEASRSLTPETKDRLVKLGLLSPTIQTLIRKSLRGVTNEVDYLSVKAHPTAFPQNGVDMARLKAQARALKPSEIMPLAVVAVEPTQPKISAQQAELTYASSFAWAFVLRSPDVVREFTIAAQGAEEFEFVQTHGNWVDVKIDRIGRNVAKVTIDRTKMSPVNRVDIAVFGRNAGTSWGAPSYVSFARMDAAAPYSDPMLTPVPPAANK